MIRKPSEGRRLDRVRVLADGDETGGAFELIETEGREGTGPPRHRHGGEGFYIVEGEYTMVVGDQTERCPAGTFIWIPAGTPHRFRAETTPARKLNLHVPAGMLGWWDETDGLAPTDPRFAAADRRYGVEWLDEPETKDSE